MYRKLIAMISTICLSVTSACMGQSEAVQTPQQVQQGLEALQQTAQESATGNVKATKTTTNQQVLKSTTMVFTGDIMPYDCVLANYNEKGIDGVVSKTFQNVLKNADITMVNEEFPFSTRGSQAPDKQFTFRIAPSKVTLLTDLGVDIVTLANNHSLDYGPQALKDTFTTLDQAKIAYTGAGRTKKRAEKLITRTENGKTFGFLAASRVLPVSSWDVRYQTPGILSTYDPAELLKAIKAADKKCDFLTVYIHWGIERATRPESYERTLAQSYIDAGADLVIGSHPHVLQGFEYYKGKAIVYSLGNFIFNHTIDSTIALKVTVNQKNKAQIKLIPGYASGAKTSALKQAKAEKIYQYLENISYGVKISKEGLLSKK